MSTKLKVTKEDLVSLESTANLAYALLKVGVEAQNTSTIEQAKHLYESGLNAHLRKLVRTISDSGPRNLSKGGKRAKKIEKYILMSILMIEPPGSKSDDYETYIIENSEDDMGGLQAYIDAEDARQGPQGDIFRLLQHRAAEIRRDKGYNLILKALDYITSKYSLSPDISTETITLQWDSAKPL